MIRRLVAAVALGALLAPGVPPAALADWAVPPTSRTTGTVKVAMPSYQFSGPTATSYVIGYTILSFVDTNYMTFTNTGGTAASFSGAVAASSGLPLGSTVTVKSCTQAWVSGNCPPGATTLLNGASLSANPALNYQVTPIPAGNVVYLQVKVGGFLATASVTLTVTTATLPPGGNDRTAG